MATYEGLAVASDATQKHLGGNIKGGDPFTYSPLAWDYLISRFAISSLLDLGSGQGYAADYFYRKNIKVLAVDGFDFNVQTSVYPSVVHDLTKGPVVTSVDLVHCQEVVEHIEEKYLDNLLSSLLCGKFIVMTHALPGQDGYHHVNCQPPEYWIEHLQMRRCSLLEADSMRVRSLAEKDGALYLAATCMVFSNNERI